MVSTVVTYWVVHLKDAFSGRLQPNYNLIKRRYFSLKKFKIIGDIFSESLIELEIVWMLILIWFFSHDNVLFELVLYDLWKKYFWRCSRNKCHEWSIFSYQSMIWYQNSTKLKRKIHWFFTAHHHHRSQQFRDSIFFLKKIALQCSGLGEGQPQGPHLELNDRVVTVKNDPLDWRQ